MNGGHQGPTLGEEAEPGLPFQQEGARLRGVPHHGRRQGGAEDGRAVGTVHEEGSDELGVVAPVRDMERGEALLALLVGVRTAGEKLGDDGRVVVLGGHEHGGAAFPVRGVERGAPFDEQADDLELPPLRRRVQGGVARLVRGIEAGALVGEEAHDLEVAEVRGH